MTNDTPDFVDLALAGLTPTAPPEVCLAADALAVALAQAVVPVAPPPALRTQLLTRLRSETPPALYTQTAEQAQWEALPFPGLERRILFLDRAHNRITFLLRAAPGAVVPAHHHSGIEEFFLLEGDLHTPDGRVLHAGDYQRSNGATDHGSQWTEQGCVALLTAPMCDHGFA